MATPKHPKEDISGADELRRVVSNMDTTSESFNDDFTAEQLLQIYRMLVLSEWDIYPDEWHSAAL
jgi:hypothetical protein